MSNNQIFRLRIQASENAFYPNKLETTKNSQNMTSADTDTPVPSTLIGIWVEILGKDCEVLFRKFLNNLPLNLPHTWPQWGPRKRQRAHYTIEVPALPRAVWLNLYEQRIAAPGQHVPEQQKHFQVSVDRW